MQPLDFMHTLAQFCPRPTSTGKEYRLSVEVLPDSFDRLSSIGKAVVNTPAGLGESLSVTDRVVYDYNMVIWKNADGSIDPLYVSVCPLCDAPPSNPPGK